MVFTKLMTKIKHVFSAIKNKLRRFENLKNFWHMNRCAKQKVKTKKKCKNCLNFLSSNNYLIKHMLGNKVSLSLYIIKFKKTYT